MKKNQVYAICMLIGLFILLIDSCKKEDEKETVSDFDGNTYNTVTIGVQVWMKENLKTTTFNDGTPISEVTDFTDWFNLTTPGYCWYDNDKEKYKETYGALYNYYAVETGKLCPTGWHVPTDEKNGRLWRFSLIRTLRLDFLRAYMAEVS
jgi:uncharacterized protein (TIGR02145 family)